MATPLCIRCGGLLVRERLFEANGMSSTEHVECDRCVNCGALEDPLIRANRQPTRAPVRTREPRGPRIRQEDLTTVIPCPADPRRPGVSLTLNFKRQCLPPVRSGTRRARHAQGQHQERTVVDDPVTLCPSPEGSE